MALIKAYRKDTGEKVRIPEHWLGHPRLGGLFRETPSSRAVKEKKAGAKVSANTEKEK